MMRGGTSMISSKPSGVSCPHCGKDNLKDNKFCKNCGKNMMAKSVKPKKKKKKMKIECPHCEETVELDEDIEDDEIECPHCEEVFEVE